MDREEEREVYLISSNDPDCEPCAEIVTALKDAISDGRVKQLDVNSKEAVSLLAPLLSKTDRIEIPHAVVKDKKGSRICEIFHDKDFTLVKCSEDEIIALREPLPETE